MDLSILPRYIGLGDSVNPERAVIATREGICPVQGCPLDNKIRPGQRIAKLRFPMYSGRAKKRRGKWGGYYFQKKRYDWAHWECTLSPEWRGEDDGLERCLGCGERHEPPVGWDCEGR